MLNTTYIEKNKWFSFNGSIVNFDHVIRVYSDKDRPCLIIEFHPQGRCDYSYASFEDRDNELAILFKFLSE